MELNRLIHSVARMLLILGTALGVVSPWWPLEVGHAQQRKGGDLLDDAPEGIEARIRSRGLNNTCDIGGPLANRTCG